VRGRGRGEESGGGRGSQTAVLNEKKNALWHGDVSNQTARRGPEGLSVQNESGKKQKHTSFRWGGDPVKGEWGHPGEEKKDQTVSEWRKRISCKTSVTAAAGGSGKGRKGRGGIPYLMGGTGSV